MFFIMNCTIYHCVPVISTEGALLHCRGAPLPIPGAGTSVTMDVGNVRKCYFLYDV